MTWATVDFHAVPETQSAIHARLLNWAAWCRGRGGPSVSPMFRQYRSTDIWAAPVGGMPVDSLDAGRIARAVVALPEDRRAATNWYYVRPVSPRRACQAIGVSVEALALLVIEARKMLIERGA
jgi:DNA-directed RNA polymerase specialized sigma24 family protein